MYDAAVQGDKLAQDIFDFTGTILGEAIADFIAFSSPEAIILFGGLASPEITSSSLSRKLSMIIS